MPQRRGSKAASRRARQRPPRRPAIPQQGPPRATAAAPTVAPETVGETTTRETARLDAPRPAPRPSASGPSGLGERARVEYHYVGRDLRNIAILAAVMVVLLVAAWIVLPATGIVAA